jgi:hypothetical protein
MLSHADPAILGRLGMFLLVLGDMVESHLLVLASLGKHRRTGKGRHHCRLTLRGLAMTHDLVIGEARDWLGATVDHLGIDVDNIAATGERVGLDHLDAIGSHRLHGQFQGVFAGLQGIFAGDQFEDRLVVGQGAADIAGLREIVAAGALFKQLEQLALVLVLAVIGQGEFADVAAMGIDHGAQDIGLDDGAGASLDAAARRRRLRLQSLSRGRQIGGRLASGDRRLGGLCADGGLLWIVVVLPGLPDHQQ